MTRTREAIDTFLRNRTDDSPFLVPRYSSDLETQVMTTTEGEPGDDPGTYTADGEVWGNKRWPYQAGTDPNYSDPQITFSPAARVERVGTTWWDYVQRRSVAVGIDIDSVEGHAETTTTNEASDIDTIIKRLKSLDYVTIVRSTGGKGLHVYVFFDPAHLPEAKNHHEHTIVARKTLELISQEINYPLKDHVDCVGSVFWIWSKSSPAGHPGFSVVKEGAYLDASRLGAINLPTPSVRGGSNTDFEKVELDAEHRRVIEAISREPYYFNIRSDMNLIHTHTCAIRDAIEHGLTVRGTFVTNSRGDDPQTANCFMAPAAGGVFRVFRFGQAQHEPQWEFKNGKNYCFLNDELSIEELLSRKSDKFRAGVYHLTPSAASEVAEFLLGEPVTEVFPDDVKAVNVPGGVEFQSKKDGGAGWEKCGELYKRTVLTTRQAGSHRDRLLRDADESVRFVTQDGKPRGWYHRLASGEWLQHRGYSDLSCVVSNMFGEFAQKAHELMMANPWEMVCLPFEEEYPGDRRWNRGAPQLAVTPADSGGDHPHFDMILEHIGTDLDEAVQTSEWCRKGSILSGADYLRSWLTCLIKHTDQPLPYLFLVGPQNSGKSIFHESARYLFTGGVTSANSALTSGFNAELAGCFLVYVEERDLNDKRLGAYERIKEWVTGRDLLIQEKYQTPYMTPNFLHFVQMANNTSHLPLEDGDTRIVAVDVPALTKPVPKAIMERHLREEAPRFLRTLLNTEIPPPVDRLRIPALRTETKTLMERRAMSPLMAYAKEKVFTCPGHKIEFPKFYEKFKAFGKSHGTEADAEFAVFQEIMLRSDRFTLGTRAGKTYLLNVTLDPKAKPKDRPLTVNSSGRF